MSLEVAPIANVVAQLLDELEEEYGASAELVQFCVVVELDVDEGNAVYVRGPEGARVSARAGLLVRAVDVTIDPESTTD